MPFDIGFFELCVIAVIGLLVLGPERLPVAARAIGRWIGKARRSFTSFKSEIDRELQIDELRRQLHEQQAKMDQFMNQRPLDDILNETPEELQSKIEQTRQDFEQQRQQQESESKDGSEQENTTQKDSSEVSKDASVAQTSEDLPPVDDFSGCENPVEYEPFPQGSNDVSSNDVSSKEPTIHPPQPNDQNKKSKSNSDEKA